MKTFIVGGAVRDVILRLPITDIDYVVVGSTPQEMIDSGFKQVGADFPVFLDEQGNEYALARTERKSGPGYKGFETDFNPSVTLEDDLFRRDLTINSLAVAVEDWDTFVATKDESLVIDPHNGLSDIHNRILRHTSEHFKDDPVRLLRIARFHAKYGFTIAGETIKLLKQIVNSGEVHCLVPERIWAEIEKALMVPNSMDFFWTLHKCAALEIILPGLFLGLTDKGFMVRKASLRELDFSIRCMWLFHNMNNVHEFLERLRVPTTIINDVHAFDNVMTLTALDMDPSQILIFLKTHIIRTPKRLKRIATALSVAPNLTYSNNFDKVIQSYNIIKNISFANLSVEQQQNLKGKEISTAINNLQLDAITALLDK